MAGRSVPEAMATESPEGMAGELDPAAVARHRVVPAGQRADLLSGLHAGRPRGAAHPHRASSGRLPGWSPAGNTSAGYAWHGCGPICTSQSTSFPEPPKACVKRLMDGIPAEVLCCLRVCGTGRNAPRRAPLLREHLYATRTPPSLADLGAVFRSLAKKTGA